MGLVAGWFYLLLLGLGWKEEEKGEEGMIQGVCM
jgi:hypothetical protein